MYFVLVMFPTVFDAVDWYVCHAAKPMNVGEIPS